MAANADSVVVELIAKTEALDRPVQQSASNFDANMNKIMASATKAETTVAKSASATSAAIQRESAQISQFTKTMATDMVGAGDLLASGRSPFVVPVKQAPQVSSAMRLISTGGILMASVLGGVVFTAGVSLIAMLVEMARKTGDESREINALVDKLKEHSRETRLSEEADRIWANTLDGLIDRQEKLNAELDKRLSVQENVDRNDLVREQANADAKQKELDQANARLTELQKRLAAAPKGAVGIGQGAQTVGVDTTVIQKQIDAEKANIAELERAVADLRAGIVRSQIVVGQTQGAAVADLSNKAQLFAKTYTGILAEIERANPKLAPFSETISEAAAQLSSATSEAASAGVEFVGVTNQVSGLDQKLKTGQLNAQKYAAEIHKLAKELHDMAQAAKDAAKQDPVKQFKSSVIGAEGTGPNQLGSSAAGFGQFMPSTWLGYFNKLFPDKAALSDAAKLGFRNVRAVAEAVIDKATDDYVALLKSLGQKVTAANLYTVHLLGSLDAKKLLSAAPGDSTRSALGGGQHADKVLAGNPFLKGTVAQAEAAIAKRIGDSSGAVSQGAVAIAQALEQEKEREARFIQAKEAIEGQILDARRELGLSAEETARIETAAADAATKRYEDDVRAKQSEGKYTADEADDLIRLSEERKNLLHEIIQRRLQQAQFAREEAQQQNALTVETGLLDAQQDQLRSAEQLARTAKERKEIEDRLIDLQFAEEKIRLQAQIDLAERLKAQAETTKNEQDIAAATRAEADAAVARAKLASIPQRQQDAHSANAQQNASPLQAYFNSIPDTADQINAAFENIAVHGLQTFNDALTDAIVNYRSLGDVGRAVLQGLEADLIKLALQLIEQHTIGAALGTAATAAGTAQAAALGAAWAGPAALASLATFGANAAPAQAALISTGAIAAIIGAPKAGGGRILGPGSPTSDRILTPLSADEFVIRAAAARQIGYDNLEALNRNGRLPGMAMGGPVRPMNIPAANPASRGGFSPSDMQQLRSIVSDAVTAMPAVNLYPTVDSGDIFRRGIKSQTGSRSLLAHIGDNSTTIKATLNRPGV